MIRGCHCFIQFDILLVEKNAKSVRRHLHGALCVSSHIVFWWRLARVVTLIALVPTCESFLRLDFQTYSVHS